jgi:DMSO/TMAO reductase YedYZ molybdopterin-dependent catalytic subunit
VAFLGLDTMEQGVEPSGFGGSIPLEKALTAETLLAYEMNIADFAPRPMDVI